MQFAYKAKDSAGKVLEGTVEASDQAAAISRLRGQRLTVVEVSSKGAGPKKIKGKVTSKDIVMFSRQLSTLVSADRKSVV